MDETHVMLRTAVLDHNVSVIAQLCTIGNEVYDRIIDVREVSRRYEAGEPIKDLLP